MRRQWRKLLHLAAAGLFAHLYAWEATDEGEDKSKMGVKMELDE
jgi:hypothetical protein